MAGAPGYTTDEAIDDARRWSQDIPTDGSSRGWRVCCAVLADRIEELENVINRAGALASQGASHNMIMATLSEFDDDEMKRVK